MMTSMGRPRGVAIAAFVALLGLASCEKPPPPGPPSCQPPALVATPSPTAEDVAHDALFNCVEESAYQGVSRGGPVAAAASGAVAQCAPAQAAYLKAIRAARPLSAYERDLIQEQVGKVAQSTAVRKRSRGCGRPGGEPETLNDTDAR